VKTPERRYSASVRPARLTLLVTVSAALGGTLALGLGAAGGWLGGSKSTTVVVTSPAAPAVSAPAAVKSAAKPIPRERFDPARIYAERAAGVVTIFAFFGEGQARAQLAQGSGFVVSPDGYVLTNSHVITNAGEGSPVKAASQVYVEFSDRDRVVADVVGWDVFDDVGLIKVDPRDHALFPVPLGDSAGVVVGEPVAAIGSPFGNQSSLAVGVVSATHRSIESLTSTYELPDAIQTDAPINHGNSGGPLFDAGGAVVGINAQIRSDSGNGEGVGFAVPINAARRSMRQLIAKGRVAYSYVGIQTEDLTPSIARHFGYKPLRGAVVVSVRAGSPADRAALQGASGEEFFRGDHVARGGDIIVAINGIPVHAADDVIRIAAERLVPGEVATFTVYRDGARRQVEIRLGERTPTPPS
jgi:2-alkenal reductase